MVALRCSVSPRRLAPPVSSCHTTRPRTLAAASCPLLPTTLNLLTFSLLYYAMVSAIERLWDALIDYAHVWLLKHSPAPDHALEDDWAQFGLLPDTLANLRRIVKASGIEALEYLLVGDDHPPDPTLAIGIAINPRTFVQKDSSPSARSPVYPSSVILADLDAPPSSTRSPRSTSTSPTTSPRPILKSPSSPRDTSHRNVGFAMDSDFCSARSLLDCSQDAVIKLSVTRIKEAYSFETIVRIVFWTPTPERLNAVVQDRYHSNMRATWASSTYPTLMPTYHHNDIVRLRGRLQIAKCRPGSSTATPTQVTFVIRYAWLEGSCDDVLSGTPKMFVHGMCAKREFEAHCMSAVKARYEAINEHIVGDMESLKALIRTNEHGTYDDVVTVPSLDMLTPQEIASDLIRSAFNWRRKHSQGTPLSLRTILRDIAKPLLLHQFSQRTHAVCQALTRLIHDGVVREAINKHGVRISISVVNLSLPSSSILSSTNGDGSSGASNFLLCTVVVIDVASVALCSNTFNRRKPENSRLSSVDRPSTSTCFSAGPDRVFPLRCPTLVVRYSSLARVYSSPRACAFQPLVPDFAVVPSCGFGPSFCRVPGLCLIPAYTPPRAFQLRVFSELRPFTGSPKSSSVRASSGWFLLDILSAARLGARSSASGVCVARHRPLRISCSVKVVRFAICLRTCVLVVRLKRWAYAGGFIHALIVHDTGLFRTTQGDDTSLPALSDLVPRLAVQQSSLARNSSTGKTATRTGRVAQSARMSDCDLNATRPNGHSANSEVANVSPVLRGLTAKIARSNSVLRLVNLCVIHRPPSFYGLSSVPHTRIRTLGSPDLVTFYTLPSVLLGSPFQLLPPFRERTPLYPHSPWSCQPSTASGPLYRSTLMTTRLTGVSSTSPVTPSKLHAESSDSMVWKPWRTSSTLISPDDDVRLPPLDVLSIPPGFVSAWGLVNFPHMRRCLLAPDKAFIKLTISHLRYAYQLIDEDGTATWWLYGAQLPEIETIVRVLEWRLTPDALEAVIEDRYGRQITATWDMDSYEVLAPPAQRDDIIRVRGSLKLVTPPPRYGLHDDQPYKLFVIRYAWLEGSCFDAQSGAPQMFIHNMQSNRAYDAHVLSACTARHALIHQLHVPSMDTLNALIEIGDHAVSDDVTTVPSLDSIAPHRDICADILYKAFLDRHFRAPGDPVTLARLLRDVARPVLICEWEDTLSVLWAMSILVRSRVLKEAVNPDGDRIYF
ncbi:uncharacterized protein B0H18DRAFT_956898 [Fomitopsis serialis]|uniref:uncharacterized protein n=1 Tax=Fomitopsis serialis TaxID=139415 RepID=UPI0020087AB0|nr:uncharacterized protein B0H18DRAFT_956898 [Neoantrodia serialis]KAH9920762.1 hypothetical protein B0H18DRAFT_956898 [Neoantrodia serialis]